MKSTFTILVAVLAIVSVSSKVLLPGDFSAKNELDVDTTIVTTIVTPEPEKNTTVTPDPEETTTITPDPEETTTVTPDPEETTTVTPDPEETTTVTPDPEETTTGIPDPDTPTTTPAGAVSISVTSFLVLLSAISMKL